MTITYKTTIKGFGNHAAIEVPPEVVEKLGAGKRAPVVVKIGDYEFKSTFGNMDGMTLIPFSSAHRESSGVNSGDTVTITLTLDLGIRKVEIPDELQKTLERASLMDVFMKLTYSKRKEFCRQVADAKTVETRQKRVEKIVAMLQINS